MAITSDIGIDLGTATVMIYMEGKGIVLNEPSVAAVDSATGKLICAGKEAYAMLGKTSGRIHVSYPLKDGVISEYKMAEQMLTYFVKKVCSHKIFMPRVIVCVPSVITGVEKRAVIDAIYSAGARKVVPIEEPLAAAIGAGVDISKAFGAMIVDVGAGTTDIAVLTLSGISSSTSIKVASNQFDDDIIRYIKNRYNIIIGQKTAEKLKTEAGSVIPYTLNKSSIAKGRNIITGLPAAVEIDSDEIANAIVDSSVLIANSVHDVIELTPPELVADIFESGIVLTGGGARIHGLDKLISVRTNTKVTVPENPQFCVAVGTGRALKTIDRFDGEENTKYRDELN